MSEIAQLITSVATLIGVVGGLYLSWRNHKGIEQIHVATNSMKDALVVSTATASRAEGVVAGRAEEKANPS